VSPSEKNYAITELETLAVVWAITHFQCHLYGHTVTVYTDHVAVKAVLGAPGSGIQEVDIVYWAKQNNSHADALSRQPVLPTPENEDTEEVQLALISSRDNVSITDLVSQPPITMTVSPSFSDEQWKDGLLQPMILYLRDSELPEDGSTA